MSTDPTRGLPDQDLEGIDATLRELSKLETGARLTRLERRDLRREDTLDQMQTYAKWGVRGVWFTAGMLTLRLVQEGGLDVIPGLASLLAG